MALTFDFALEGFRTIRERPKLILFWGAASLFGNGLGGLVLIAFSGPALATVMSIGTKQVEPSFAVQLLGEMLPGFLAWLPFNFLTTAVLNGAVCRAGLGEGDDRFGFLQFGLDEIRILLVLIAKLVLTAGIFLAAILVAGVGAVAVPGSADGLVAAGMLAAAFGVIWLEVRLSLNVPQTFATRRVDIFGSFALTHGRFWPLFWGYAGATGLTLCVAFLCGKVIAGIEALAFGEAAAKALPDLTSLHAYLTPQTLTYDGLSNGLMVPLLMAIVLGAPVAAYRMVAPLPGPVITGEKV